MIYASHRHRTGTDLTRLTPDPDTLPPPAEGTWTFLQHPTAGGQRGTPSWERLGAGRGAKWLTAALHACSSISAQHGSQAFLRKEPAFLCFEI